MPHLPTVLPETETDRDVVTYVHRRGSNVRIQLDAADDERDHRGRTIKRGYSTHVHFEKGLFTTNIEKFQEGLESSYAYKAGEVQRESELIKRANDKQLESLLEIAAGNPELASELRSRLTKMSISAAQAQRKGEASEPTGTITTSESEE